MRTVLLFVFVSFVLFEACSSGDRQQEKSNEPDYLALGKEYALATKAVLGRNLQAAIQERGTAGALEFCNTRAYPLTDSTAQALNARIRRASDQPRNPDNRATGPELTYIHQAKNAMAAGKPVQPQLQRDGQKVTAYYPITTDAFCLQCHGTPGVDIAEETLAKIQELYPEDRATGYTAEELRGIWVVEME